MAWLIVSLRRLREAPLPTLALAALAFLSSLVFAAAPRLLSGAADGVLRGEVSAAPPVERNLQLVQESVSQPRRGRASGAAAVGRALGAEFPPAVAALVGPASTVIDTSRWSPATERSSENTLRFRFQEGAADRVRLLAGVLPTGRTGELPPPADAPADSAPVPLFEGALSSATARQLHLTVGDTLPLRFDRTDPLAGNANPSALELQVALRVVGIFDVLAPQDEFWSGDSALVRPSIRPLGLDAFFADSTALLASDAFPALLDVTQPPALAVRYTWRYPVDAARLESARVPELRTALRRMQSTFSAPGGRSGPTEDVVLRTGLLRLVDDFAVRWASAAAVLAVFVTGAAVVCAASIALASAFAGERRRAAISLWRERGASSLQILASLVAEAFVVVVPSAAAGAAVALLLFPVGAVLPSLVAAGAVAVVAAVLLVATAGAPLDRARDRRGTAQAAVRGSPRRLAAEGLVVVLGLSAAYLLAQRGVRGSSSTGALGGADPLVAAAPALAAAAVSLIVMRLFPLPVRPLAAFARTRRGLLPTLALRRITSGGGGGAVLVVLLTTAAMATFGSATLVHLGRVADVMAWQQLGADYRVRGEGAALPAAFDAASLPGVEAAALAHEAVVTVRASGARLRLLALDGAAYARVTSGTPVSGAIPPDLLSAAGPGALPAIVSSDVPGFRAFKIGDNVDATLQGFEGQTPAFRSVTIRVAGLRASFPAVPREEAFLVISREQLRSVLPGFSLPDTTAFLRAPGDVAGALRAATAAASSELVVEARAEEAARFRGTPLVEAVMLGVAIAAGIAALYAALAVAAGFALSSAAGAVDLAHLRALGLKRGEAARLLAAEHLPTIVVAFVAGASVGLGLFVLVRAGLGLGVIVGSEVEVPLGVEPAHLALILIAIAVIVALALAVALRVQRSVVPALALRRGAQ